MISDLKPGEKAVLRYKGGCLGASNREIMFNGNMPGFVSFRDVRNLKEFDENKISHFNLSENELFDVDSLLGFLRSSRQDVNPTTANRSVEIEWFDGREAEVEKYKIVALCEEGIVLLLRLFRSRTDSNKDS